MGYRRLGSDEQKIQVLRPFERKYPARISSSAAVRGIKYTVRKLPVYNLLQRLRKGLIDTLGRIFQ